MSKFTYCTIRYVYDLIRGEFINIGIALYSPKEKYFNIKFTSEYTQISKIFSSLAKTTEIKRIIRIIESESKKYTIKINNGLGFEKYDNIVKLLTKIIPAEDGSIQFSDEMGGISENPKNELKDLFERFVSRKSTKPIKKFKTDKEIMDKFKQALKKKNLGKHLKKQTITTPVFEYNFQVIQNGRLNAINTVSFDVDNKSEMYDKTIRFRGLYDCLKDSQLDHVRFHLIVGEPTNTNYKKIYENCKKLVQESSTKPKIVEEKSIDDFVNDLGLGLH